MRFASLQIYDLFYNNIDYSTYTKNMFAQKFDFLNIQFNQINFISKHQINIGLAFNKKYDNLSNPNNLSNKITLF
jgi:hypothetical protein